MVCIPCTCDVHMWCVPGIFCSILPWVSTYPLLLGKCVFHRVRMLNALRCGFGERNSDSTCHRPRRSGVSVLYRQICPKPPLIHGCSGWIRCSGWSCRPEHWTCATPGIRWTPTKPRTGREAGTCRNAGIDNSKMGSTVPVRRKPNEAPILWSYNMWSSVLRRKCTCWHAVICRYQPWSQDRTLLVPNHWREWSPIERVLKVDLLRRN